MSRWTEDTPYERDIVFFFKLQSYFHICGQSRRDIYCECIALHVTNNSKSLKYNVQYKSTPLSFSCTHIFSENIKVQQNKNLEFFVKNRQIEGRSAH